MIQTCSYKPGGYSATSCDIIKSVAKPFSKSSTGILHSRVVDTNSKEEKGTRFTIVPKAGDTPLAMSLCPFCAGLLRDISIDESEHIVKMHSRILKTKHVNAKTASTNVAGTNPCGQNLNREDVRAEVQKIGITTENITLEEISDLMTFLRINLKAAALYKGTLALKNRKATKYLTLKCQNWDSRECISFNSDGFIGFAGWADNKNIQPILAAVMDWVNFYKSKKEKSPA